MRRMHKTILLSSIPDALHRRLGDQAASVGLSLSAYLSRELRKIAERATAEEMRDGLQQREPYDGGCSPTQLIPEHLDWSEPTFRK